MSATHGEAGPPEAPRCAGPDFAPREPQLVLPAGACDCHAHVLGPAAQYPYSDERIYTPPDCLPSDYRNLLSALGLSRAVLVQPSVYGTDNRLLVDTLRNDPRRFRGVAVIEPDIGESDLMALHEAGVRGARVNLVDRRDRSSTLPIAYLRRLGERIAPLGWHLELLAHVDQHAEELAALRTLPLQVVFGHFGYMTATSRGAADPGFQALLGLLEGGSAWVKLTGSYRITAAALPYPPCDALAAALRDVAPERLLWGSDWPHVMLKGAMPNDADLVDLLPRWLPDESLIRQVLVVNPRELYGFEDQESN
jgi:2-pyrone-4,6-dicarboxylate lactonase